MQSPESPELRIFRELTQIPRPSGSLAKIQKYLTDFAETHHLASESDAAGNVRILHPGTSPRSIILQAHMDMVAVVEDGCAFDFTKDAVTAEIRDGWMYAKHTTLGADDGSGVAIALSALTDPALKDCSMAAIFTADEETTMSGAAALSPSWLDADALVNIDNDHAGEAVLSSAGASAVLAECSPETEVPPEEAKWYRLTIDGLLSGHSGQDIDKGRQNAILLAADFLSGLDGLRIAELNGGTVDNAIPAKAEALFSTTSNPIAYAETWLRTHRVETDPGLSLAVTEAGRPLKSYTAAFSKTLLKMLLAIQNGLLEKDAFGPTLSSNLGVLRAGPDTVSLNIFIRSNADAKRDEAAKKALAVCEEAGAKAVCAGKCPGWSTEGETDLMRIAREEYLKLGHGEIRFASTHGGLECGYFAEKNPDLMLLCVGPTVENPHTVHERMNLATFRETKDLVFSIVKRLCG